MNDRLSLAKTFVILALALGVSLVPMALGILLGFGAFVVTPFAMAILLFILGGVIVRLAPDGRWRGAALAAAINGIVFAALPIAVESVLNARPPQHILSSTVPLFFGASICCGMVLAAGVWWFGPVPVRAAQHTNHSDRPGLS